MISQPHGKMDCYGKTQTPPRFQHCSDHYLIGDIRPTLYIHDSSLSTRDNARVFGSSQGQLLVVIDGVGDRPSAARASAIALDTVNSSLLSLFRLPNAESVPRDQNIFDDFACVLEECRSAMVAELDAGNRFEQMAAVMTLVYIVWPTAYVIHLGNTRAYLYRQRRLDQLTNDHTMAHRLVDAGALSARRADESQLRNVVWNVVGTHSKHPAPECTEMTLALGDTLVLCSDGLVTATRDEEICQALEQTTSAEAACESLFAYGRQRGFQDDATAIIARFSTTQKATGHMTAEFSTSRGRAEPPADADASQLEATLPKQKSRLSAEETGEGPLPTSG